MQIRNMIAVNLGVHLQSFFIDEILVLLQLSIYIYISTILLIKIYTLYTVHIYSIYMHIYMHKISELTSLF